MNKYWFRKRLGLQSKDLGWGWVPISWEGWLVIVGIVGIVVTAAVILFGEDMANNTDPSVLNGFVFLLVILGSLCLGAFISSKKTRP